MNAPFKEWLQELELLDTPANHLETLNELEAVYLESDGANYRPQRVRTMVLLRHLKKLF
jgi:hypothetical protein